MNYTKEGWQKEVLKITGGKGVDVIYDPVGLIRGAHALSVSRRACLMVYYLRLAEVHRMEGAGHCDWLRCRAD